MQKRLSDLTADRLRDALSYDCDSGVFRWKIKSAKHIKIGAATGCKNNSGYLRIRVDGTLYRAHRLAWLYVHGEWPKHEIDHINGIPSDNRICNLRLASHAENGQNLALSRRNTSGFHGVSWSKFAKKWHAYIRINNVNKHLGHFKNIEDAVAARVKAKADIHTFQPYDRVRSQ